MPCLHEFNHSCCYSLWVDRLMCLKTPKISPYNLDIDYFPVLHIVLTHPWLTPVARFMLCNFKMDRYKFLWIGSMGFVTKQMHTSRFGSPSLPVIVKWHGNSLPCWVISWSDKVHHFFPSLQKSKDDRFSFTAFNKSMAEVNCVALKDIRPFCHATRFRFSHNY